MNGDLISREVLKNEIEEVQYSQEFCIEHHIDYSVSMQMLGMVINNAPTVEVGYLTNCANCEKVEKIRAKRPQGEWVTWEEAGNDIASPNRHECSCCHDSAQVLVNGIELLSDFCPNCGADMRGGRE